MSNEFVQPIQDPSANCCEFQADDENIVALQLFIPDNVGGKHGQPLGNEINFADLTACNEELHHSKIMQRQYDKTSWSTKISEKCGNYKQKEIN